MYDLIIIGAGVVGSSIAREISKYKLSVCVLERCNDVCQGTSKANSAISHAGFDAVPGTLMAKLNVDGNRRLKELSKELEFPYQEIGALVTCKDSNGISILEELYDRGKRNGVENLRILGRKELLRIEPNISDNTIAALYAPTSGILCPFNFNIAMAENAMVNGVEFKFNTEVLDIEKEENIFHITTDSGDIRTRYIVNSAGVYADRIHNMVCENKVEIVPKKGEYFLLDKNAGNHVSHTVFTLPDKNGKGVLVTPTVHGNLLVGPTADDIWDKEGCNTTKSGSDNIFNKSKAMVKNIPYSEIITGFAGLRAAIPGVEDFIIQESEPNFIDCLGIKSPGLTASPAIGVMVADMLRDKENPDKKDNFRSKRRGITNINTLTESELNSLIEKNPWYGNIICRCETVSEGEIIEAIKSPIGAKDLDGIKRRVRPGAGRCQGGFCSPRVMEILAREIPDLDMEHVSKHGIGSNLIVDKCH